jgi:hypothetical protein
MASCVKVHAGVSIDSPIQFENPSVHMLWNFQVDNHSIYNAAVQLGNLVVVDSISNKPAQL